MPIKLNNNLVVFDLETTDDPKRRAIIELGATIVFKDFSIGPTFSKLVYTDEPVSEFVQKLTGHSSESILSAERYPSLVQSFESWVTKECGNIKNCRLSAWGNYFDINVLRAEYEKYELNFPFSGTAIDVKTVGFAYLAMSGGRTDSFSVEKTANLLGIKLPEGARYHQAGCDSYMTAKIFVECMNRINGGIWVDKQYIKVGI